MKPPPEHPSLAIYVNPTVHRISGAISAFILSLDLANQEGELDGCDTSRIILNGDKMLNGGTSMSAPIFAAIINRINEERISAGKKPLGFVNPALYRNPSMFNDITSGDQSGGNGNCNGKGFKAASGWDSVTGLGTPKYPEMLAYFKNL
ncbi:hypothetical protein MY1884_009698 [Beauveria asiatica]